MSAIGWAQIGLFLVLLLAITPLAGRVLYRLAAGGPLPGEGKLLRTLGIVGAEQGWRAYAASLLAFKAAGALLAYGLLRAQAWLPLNPAGQDAVAPDLALNTAISFVTNTNWQSYGGETTMSHLSQMAVLTVQNFASAAGGVAVAFAVMRGFARQSAATIGNFWVDLLRVGLWLLLPASLVIALVMVWQGVPQTLAGTVEATTLEGAKQIISLGPVASQEAIKMLGTNGGGFFNANSAHPFENPTVLTNLLQMLAIFSLGAGLTNCFGRMVGQPRQGWAIFAAMMLLFVAGAAALYAAEGQANPLLPGLAANMEGKEVRFGVAMSALFSAITTAASCGAVNAMISSLMPLAGMVALVNMMLGEIIFGGVGSGLYGFILFAIIAMFVAGLMVGRTPEYLGKKIEAREVKLTMLAILCLPLVMLGFTALAVVLPAGLAGLSGAGPHGFSEALYAYVSAGANNGSAFAGISANTPFWNGTLAAAMLVGRFFVTVPVLAIAGALAAKKSVPASAGTFPTDGGLFVGLVIGVILIVGGLTFLPALALGPIVEHLALVAGQRF